MAVNFDFLHIKARTAGSSNELSFDVLEHKSAEADGKVRPAKQPKAPTASQGNYKGVSGTLTLSGQAEVERRKKARRSHRARIWAVVIVAIVAVVAVGVYAGVRFHEERMDFAGKVNMLVDRLSVVDEELVVIDDMMADPLAADNAEKRKNALTTMPKLMSELNRISTDAQSLAELATDDRSRELVDQVSKAALARNGMMSVAGETFRFSTEANGQIDRSNKVWNKVLNADQLIRGAVSDANKATTPDAASAALDNLRNAHESFADALYEMQDISNAYDINLSAQKAYLDKKVEALEYAIETSEKLLAGDRDAAKQANEQYNEADSEAVQLAAKLPPSPTEAVRERFSVLMGDYQDRYEEARNKTVEADSVIREYLG